MFHPWRFLRHLPSVVVEWVRPHPRFVAATDGKSRIWIDPRLSQVERRCVLTHEILHIQYGHKGCQPLAVERMVRADAARYLIVFEDLQSAAAWALSVQELADELWVTEMVLQDRLRNLETGEWQLLPCDVRRYAKRLWGD